MKIASTQLVAALLAGAFASASADPAPSDPASALCIENGATVTIETLPNGARHAVCAFSNGSRIDAATYFRNKHRTR